jgi:hypothetical protein
MMTAFRCLQIKVVTPQGLSPASDGDRDTGANLVRQRGTFSSGAPGDAAAARLMHRRLTARHWLHAGGGFQWISMRIQISAYLVLIIVLKGHYATNGAD